MSAGHTPGPWRAEFGDKTTATEIWSEDGLIIADVHSHVLGDDDFHDASLIAAAPDLLAAAAAASLCILEMPRTQARSEVAQMLCDAIAKANGGEA